jgi:P27 family predicted phage terminase small subunit
VAKKPGPAPQSAEVVKLHGNRAHLTKAEIEARVAAEAATPKPKPIRASDAPSDLSIYARECWQMHAPELDELGLLSVLDRGSFRLACECYAIARSALDEMRFRKADGTPDERKKGLQTIVQDTNHGTMRRHPALIVFGQFAASYRQWCSEFGLTPSARLSIRPAAGVHRPSPEEGEGDGEFFGT